MHCKLNDMVVDEQEFAFEADRPPKSRNTPNSYITWIRRYMNTLSQLSAAID